jgi:hypothetical protein
VAVGVIQITPQMRILVAIEADGVCWRKLAARSMGLLPLSA